MRTNSAVLILLIATGGYAQEKKDPKLVPIAEIKLDRKDPVVFEKDIRPILKDKCTVCHSGRLTEGNLDLSSFEKMMKGGKRGVPIVAGKADDSLLYKLSSRKMAPAMPPGKDDPFTPQELALVKLWIDQGAKPPAQTVEKKDPVIVGVPPATVKPVRAVAVHGDKTPTIASGRGNQIHLYSGSDGKHLKSLTAPGLTTHDKKPVQAAHLSIVESMAFAPDGKTLATGSFQEVILWDVDSGAVKQKISGFADRVVAISYSPDGKHFATAGGGATEDGELKVFDASGKMVVEIKSAHSDTVFGVSFSPDNTKLASCGADKFVKTWELPSGKLIKSFEGHTHHVMDVGWGPDGKILASGGADNNVKIWDFEKGEQQRTINAHQKQVTRLLFVGKTPTFITTSGDLTAKLWSAANGGNQRNFTGSPDFVYALGVSSDGKTVVLGGEDGAVRVYNGDAGGAPQKVLYPPGEEPKKEEPKKEEPKKK